MEELRGLNQAHDVKIEVKEEVKFEFIEEVRLKEIQQEVNAKFDEEEKLAQRPQTAQSNKERKVVPKSKASEQ